MAYTLFPPIACKSDGTRYPWVIRCNGDKFAGAETPEAAERMRAAYQDQPRPGGKGTNKYLFTVERHYG